MDEVFTQVETWLNTGLVMPGKICTLERIMRELGRRLKRPGYGWTDEGITRAAKRYEERGLLGFREAFGTEEACVDHLRRIRWPDGFV